MESQKNVDLVRSGSPVEEEKEHPPDTKENLKAQPPFLQGIPLSNTVLKESLSSGPSPKSGEVGQSRTAPQGREELPFQISPYGFAQGNAPGSAAPADMKASPL